MIAPHLHLDSFIPYRLSFTATLMSDSIASIYQRLFAITVPEWRVIAWVAQADGITQQEIVARVRMDKMTVSRAVAALVRRGILEQSPHPVDGRSRLLGLSQAGQALYDEIAPKALELEARIFDGFHPDEVGRFVEMLRAIDARVQALG